MEESFVQCAYALFDYMTQRSAVQEDATLTQSLIIEGSFDAPSLLYHFLDELLFRFLIEPFLVVTKIDIHTLDIQRGTLTATIYGGGFDPTQHPWGTEVKAITKSNLQVSRTAPFDIYVIFDI